MDLRFFYAFLKDKGMRIGTTNRILSGVT